MAANSTAYSANTSTPCDNFADENYRVPSNYNFDTVGAPTAWTSSNSIANAGSTGYNDGLQVYNGSLVYPSINFSTLTNGPTSNVNYSGGTCTGARTYYRYFYFSPTGHANFSLKITTSGTTPTVVNWTATPSSRTGNQMTVAFKLPNGGSAGTGWMDCNQAYTGSTSNGSGILNSGTFNLNAINNMTIGGKNVSNTGYYAFLQIQVSSAVSTNCALTGIILTGN